VGTGVRAYIDGKLLFDVHDGELVKGKVGVTANIPSRFQDFQVSASEEAKQRIEERIGQHQTELARLRADNPQPKLWRKFSTPNFGAGRNVRFGDLDGDGRLDTL